MTVVRPILAVVALLLSAGARADAGGPSILRTDDGGLLLKVQQGSSGVQIQESGKEPVSIAELPEDVERVRKDVDDQAEEITDMTTAIVQLAKITTSCDGAADGNDDTTGSDPNSDPNAIPTTLVGMREDSAAQLSMLSTMANVLSMQARSWVAKSINTAMSTGGEEMKVTGRGLVPGAPIYTCRFTYTPVDGSAAVVVKSDQVPTEEGGNHVVCTIPPWPTTLGSQLVSWETTFQLIEGANAPVPCMDTSAEAAAFVWLAHGPVIHIDDDLTVEECASDGECTDLAHTVAFTITDEDSDADKVVVTIVQNKDTSCFTAALDSDQRSLTLTAKVGQECSGEEGPNVAITATDLAGASTVKEVTVISSGGWLMSTLVPSIELTDQTVPAGTTLTVANHAGLKSISEGATELELNFLEKAPLTSLSGSNDGGKTNLQACTGECDADSQCSGGLKCFQRNNGESIPGCSGNGNGNDWDYCYDPDFVASTAACPSDKPELLLLHQTQGTGHWEFVGIESWATIGTGCKAVLTAGTAVKHSYTSDNDPTTNRDFAQAVPVLTFEKLVVAGEIATTAWNGNLGGIIAISARSVNVMASGSIQADHKGFAPGEQQCSTSDYQWGQVGEGMTSRQGTTQKSPLDDGTGGGGGNGQGGGAGGGHVDRGSSGVSSGCSNGGASEGGYAFAARTGADDQDWLSFGGGGGAAGRHGSCGRCGTRGGNSGGIVIIVTQDDLTVAASGTVSAKGEKGYNGVDVCQAMGGGGGGSGGSLYLASSRGSSSALPSLAQLDVSGGDGGAKSGSNSCGPAGKGGTGSDGYKVVHEEWDYE